MPGLQFSMNEECAISAQNSRSFPEKASISLSLPEETAKGEMK